MNRALPLALVVALAGCGTPAATSTTTGRPAPDDATDPGLVSGSPVIVVARESAARNSAGSKAEDGKVFMMFQGNDPPFGNVPDGTRAIVLEDKNPSWGELGAVQVRIDEGEYTGKVGGIARSCLVEVKSPR